MFVHYSFYLESEVGSPASNVAPEFVFIKRIPDGATINTSNIQINNLGEGLYSFSLDWSLYDQVRDDGSRNSLFLKINTGLETLDQKYLTMRIERQDYLPELVDNIQVSANSLNLSASSLESKADSILTIEEGHWIINQNKLFIFNKNLSEIEMIEENASYVFTLKDNNGQPTNQDIYQRINLNS